jgi:hypothetical protein
MTKRSPRDLGTAEIGQLRRLNQKLVETQDWIRQRAAQCLNDYFQAGGLKQHQHSEDLHEDVEVDAEIMCRLSQQHPDFDVDESNTVAVLLWCEQLDDDDNWNEFRFVDQHPLSDEHHCWLFHDLCDHVLKWDLEKILSIGGLWVDIKLIQQRQIYWK